MALKQIRKLRHWKQRFDENAKFVWRRSVTWGGEPMVIGSKIPADLASNRAKLKRFWASQIIELAQFDEPDVVTGLKPVPVVPGPDTVSGTDGDDTVGGTDGDDTLSGSDSTTDVDAETPESLVSKEAERKWRVKGLEETFPSKARALEEAEKLLKAF